MTPEEEPQEPTFPRPWYYRPEYMIPMFIFWPVWGILVLRSPWNKNTIMGGVAWAHLIVFGVMAFKWIEAGSYQPIMTFYVPGVLLTLVTQVQWAVHRSKYSAAAQEAEEQSDVSGPPRPTARRRRRNSRTGRSKG
ncbi:MAG: hypothetical protein FI731_05195 [SAR202 cluster bacterium]|nr:hypothetical protein [SAR202 cluster bacterium]